MNDALFSAVKHICQTEVIKKQYMVFTESDIGEINYYGNTETEDWEYMFSYDRLGWFSMRNINHLHLFSFSFQDDLEWVESRNIINGDSTIPVDIDDATFMFFAKEAHKRDVTINEVMVDAVKEMCKKNKFKGTP